MDPQPAPARALARTLPLAPPEDLPLDAALRQAEGNLTCLAAAFDAIAAGDWTRCPATAPDSDGPHRGTTLLEALCFARDEEAWVLGRRIVQLYQEESPAFEHLTFEMAVRHAGGRYEEPIPGRAFGELFRHRMAWLQLARGEAPLLANRRGRLPDEEGGGEAGFAELLRAALERDLRLCRFVLALRSALG